MNTVFIPFFPFSSPRIAPDAAASSYSSLFRPRSRHSAGRAPHPPQLHTHLYETRAAQRKKRERRFPFPLSSIVYRGVGASPSSPSEPPPTLAARLRLLERRVGGFKGFIQIANKKRKGGGRGDREGEKVHLLLILFGLCRVPFVSSILTRPTLNGLTPRTENRGSGEKGESLNFLTPYLQRRARIGFLPLSDRVRHLFPLVPRLDRQVLSIDRR